MDRNPGQFKLIDELRPLLGRRLLLMKQTAGPEDANVDAVTKRINGPAMDAAASRRQNLHQMCYPAFK